MAFDLRKKSITVPYTEKNEEKEFSLEIKPLNIVDYQKLISVITSLQNASNIDENDAAAGLDKLTKPEVSEIILELFPKYCSNLKGLRVIKDEGEVDATVEDLVGVGYFLPFTFQVLVKLIQFSSLDDSDKKK